MRLSRQTGLTLLELVVSLLVMTILTSVAITSVSGIQEQARYEKTVRLGKEFVKAIVDINERSIRGFVADTGSLPDNPRQLLTNVSSTDPTLESVSAFGPTAFSLTTQCIIKPHGDSSALSNATHIVVYSGWSGPYLQTTSNPDDPDALRDAWGGAQNSEGDNINYGWVWNRTGDRLSIDSYGCDKARGTTGACDNGQYEEDLTFAITTYMWKSKPIERLSVTLSVTTDTTSKSLRACILHRDVNQPFHIKALLSSTTNTGNTTGTRTITFPFPTPPSIPSGEAFVALVLTTQNKTYQEKPLQKIDILPGSYFPVVFW